MPSVITVVIDCLALCCPRTIILHHHHAYAVQASRQGNPQQVLQVRTLHVSSATAIATYDFLPWLCATEVDNFNAYYFMCGIADFLTLHEPT